ncbi:MAG: hypothetical protein ABR541_09140, partial [Candidatus Dormibacteria bacterium]
GGELHFAVTDDGRGFEPGTTPRGSGLQNIADRLDALGGGVELHSTPGQGTTVAGHLPVEAGEPAASSPGPARREPGVRTGRGETAATA